jgi:hypothetical protein
MEFHGGSMATNPRQAERESSDPRKAADQTGQTSRTMADAAERTTRVGAEAFQRNAEGAKETWQGGAKAASRIAQRSMEQLSKMFGLSGEAARETVEQSSANMQAVMESTSIIAGGLQDVASEWMRFAQARVEQNLDHLDQLRECRSLQDCVALQTQIVRDNLEAFLQSAHRTSERTMATKSGAILDDEARPASPPTTRDCRATVKVMWHIDSWRSIQVAPPQLCKSFLGSENPCQRQKNSMRMRTSVSTRHKLPRRNASAESFYRWQTLGWMWPADGSPSTPV